MKYIPPLGSTDLDSSYIDGNPITGTRGSVVPAEALEFPQREIVNVIKEAGLEPDNGDLKQLFKAMQMLIEEAVNSKQTLLYPSAFVSLYEQSPPSGFYVRNGGIITNADTTVPKLWEALQKPENAWKCKTQAQWTALSNATPWSGIGGVPFFVVDTSAKTIRLPDTRGMYEEGSGFDNLLVGGVKTDMIRNITGSASIGAKNGLSWSLLLDGATSPSLGVFGPSTTLPTTVSYATDVATSGHGGLSIDVSKRVPTGPVNRPRSFGVLHCVYAGI